MTGSLSWKAARNKAFNGKLIERRAVPFLTERQYRGCTTCDQAPLQPEFASVGMARGPGLLHRFVVVRGVYFLGSRAIFPGFIGLWSR